MKRLVKVVRLIIFSLKTKMKTHLMLKRLLKLDERKRRWKMFLCLIFVITLHHIITKKRKSWQLTETVTSDISIKTSQCFNWLQIDKVLSSGFWVRKSYGNFYELGSSFTLWTEMIEEIFNTDKDITL